MSDWIDDGRGGAYRVVGHLALRVRPTDSARRWLCSVEQAPPSRLVADLGDGFDDRPPVRVVRGREPGRVLVPAQERTGSRVRAMAYAGLMALRLLDDARAVLDGE